MRNLIAVVAALILVFGTANQPASAMQSHKAAALSGSSLKWLYAAEPVIRRNNLNLDDYTVEIFEWRDYVSVSLTKKVPDETQRTDNGFEVEIGKKDLDIRSSGFLR
jgi:hypothetical protein